MKPLEEMGKYATVVVDPPWDIKFGGGAKTREEQRKIVRAHRPPGKLGDGWGFRQRDYESMTIEEIKMLPISKVLDSDAWLFLWTTQAYLPKCYDILSAWDLQYACTMVWHKPFGIQPFERPMYNVEFILVGKRGRPRFVDVKRFFAANTWPNPRVHSKKPEGFYDLLRRVTPGPRLDVFGRRRIAGFRSWGDEAPEGEPLPEHYQLVL